MFNHEIFAATLARAVDLMRQGDARDQQKAALRALLALAASGSASVRCYDGVLSVDDVAIASGVPHTGSLAGRLAMHGIAEIAIGRGAEAAELLALLRALGEDPGTVSVKERLREAKSGRIWVLLTDPDKQVKRSSLSRLFDPSAAPPSRGAKERPEDGDTLAEWNALHAAGSSSGTIREIDLGILPEPEETAAPAPAGAPAPPPEPVVAPELPIRADTPLGEALLRIALHPHDGNVLDRLTVLADRAQEALLANAVEDVLRALAMVARFEQDAAEGTPRNSYRIVLGRVLTRDTLARLAPFTTDPRLAEDAAAVFTRAGADATDVLLGLLAASEQMRERRAYMRVLRAMPQGRDAVIAMLGHPQWFVARNVAELAGELKLEEAVPDLGRLLAHQDARVRRAAAIALAKIGTDDTVEPLGAALRGDAADLRKLVASQIGGERADRFTMALAALLDTEEDPGVLREVCLALARISTADALQALERAAGRGSVFSRRARAARQAAEEALKRARRP